MATRRALLSMTSTLKHGLNKPKVGKLPLNTAKANDFRRSEQVTINGRKDKMFNQNRDVLAARILVAMLTRPADQRCGSKSEQCVTAINWASIFYEELAKVKRAEEDNPL